MNSKKVGWSIVIAVVCVVFASLSALLPAGTAEISATLKEEIASTSASSSPDLRLPDNQPALIMANPILSEQVSTKPFSAKLARDFDAADDYRVLLQSLFQRGDEGARLYAITILSICSRAHDKVENLSEPGSSREQDAAKQLLKSRCGSFSSVESSDEYMYSVVKDSRISRDPLSSLLNDLGRANSERNNEKRLSLIKDVLDTQDPILLGRATILQSSPGGSTRFDGEEISDTNSLAILTLALQAAICATGFDCGPRNPDVLNYCVFYDECFPNRQLQNRIWVSKNYGEHGLNLYERVLPKMEGAIRNRDPSVFR